jgi:hypothetical protein
MDKQSPSSMGFSYSLSSNASSLGISTVNIQAPDLSPVGARALVIAEHTS